MFMLTGQVQSLQDVQLTTPVKCYRHEEKKMTGNITMQISGAGASATGSNLQSLNSANSTNIWLFSVHFQKLKINLPVSVCLSVWDYL